MDNVKNDEYYIQKIKKDLEFITIHTKNIGIEDLSTNEILLDAMLFRMIQISENVRRLSFEYIIRHNNIPWNSMVGFRNRIVHDYGNVDMKIVYDTLKKDVPKLMEMI